MKKIKKKILAVVAGCMFAGLMMLNVNITFNDSNFSVTGLTSMAFGTTGDCAFCPDPDELRMVAIQCPSGAWLARCSDSGNGCNVSLQSPYTCNET